MSDDDAYKLNVVSARFEMKKIIMKPALPKDHNMASLKSNDRYLIRRSEIKTFSIPKSNIQFVKESLFSAQLPCPLVIRLLDSQALTGHIKKNTFNSSTSITYASMMMVKEYRFVLLLLTIPMITSLEHLERFSLEWA